MCKEDMKILIFCLDKEYYAADIGDVERILEFTKPTHMPNVPSFVEGVINYEDSILPIINLSKKFNLLNDKINEEVSKIIVIKRQGKKFGVVVDEVYEVSDVKGSMFEEAPQITISSSQKYIKGLVKMDKKIIIVLDIGKVLSEEEEEMIF